MDSNEAHDECTGNETKIEHGHLGYQNYSVDSSEALDKFTGEGKEEKAKDRCNLDEEEGERGSWKDEVMVFINSSFAQSVFLYYILQLSYQVVFNINFNVIVA